MVANESLESDVSEDEEMDSDVEVTKINIF